MTISLGTENIETPVFLAPLAGITDVPFRNLVASFGAGLVVSEMIASQDILTKRPGAREKAMLGQHKVPTSVQISGRDTYWMAEAARVIEGLGARIVDINMGCPAKQVTSGYSGSALMKEPDHALSLIEAVIGATKLPVTLKMRLGWDDNLLNAPEIAKRAEAAGIQMVTIHGRTRCQFYKGQADWHAISKVKAAVSIPVVANGDIVDIPTAKTALKHSCADAVMVGRGSQGAPWVLRDISDAISANPPQTAPSGAALCDLVTAHYQDMLGFYGKDLGVRVARKHLGWYMDRAQTPHAIRQSILREDCSKKVEQILKQAFIVTTKQVAA